MSLSSGQLSANYLLSRGLLCLCHLSSCQPTTCCHVDCYVFVIYTAVSQLLTFFRPDTITSLSSVQLSTKWLLYSGLLSPWRQRPLSTLRLLALLWAVFSIAFQERLLLCISASPSSRRIEQTTVKGIDGWLHAAVDGHRLSDK